MTTERLKFLLAAAADHRLTAEEEAELARLLENPAHQAIAERELAPLKHRFGAALDFHHARRATSPEIPAARLAALVAGVAGHPAEAPAAARPLPFLLRWRPALATLAVAACLSLLFWVQKPRPTTADAYEFGLVATSAPVRGDVTSSASNLGPNWRVVAQNDLAALRSWSSADLPKSVSVRVWVDEETGKLRALHRRADGTVTSAETPITTTTSLEDQVKRFVARLALGP